MVGTEAMMAVQNDVVLQLVDVLARDVVMAMMKMDH